MNKEALNLLHAGAFLPAMPLVLDENRKFDEAGQRRLVRYYMEAGVDGLAVAVHTTQFTIRDPKINLFETVLRVVKSEMDAYAARSGRQLLAVAGVCGEAPQAVAEAKLAGSIGYDAVLVSPGGMGHLTEQQLIERTRLIAEVMPVVGFYLQVAVGGRVFSYDYWKKVCAIQNVVAVKAAPFNRYLTADVARAIAFADHEITLYTGNDDSIVTDLLTTYSFQDGDQVRTCRVKGGLLGHWSAWTKTAVDMFRKIKALPEGAPVDPSWYTLAAQVTDVNSAFFDSRNNFAGVIAGMHEVLHRQGLLKGIWCLDPEEGLGEGQAEEISRVYAQYPELNDDAFVAEFLKKDREMFG
ncbi:MAG: dihydrodipicolinate synthase family protein [Clostridia bacterium]|nr:dihydrodipicolinate synthase family protein [Clostridia bacterium]